MLIDAEQVINFHGLKPKHFNLDKEDTGKLEQIVMEWILQSQDLINSYTHRQFTDENVKPAVQNVCLRLTSNMVALAIQRRDSPIIKVNDWTIQSVSSDVFTDDLKADLSPFVIDHSTVSDHIDIFAITGSDDQWLR